MILRFLEKHFRYVHGNGSHRNQRKSVRLRNNYYTIVEKHTINRMRNNSHEIVKQIEIQNDDMNQDIVKCFLKFAFPFKIELENGNYQSKSPNYRKTAFSFAKT